MKETKILLDYIEKAELEAVWYLNDVIRFRGYTKTYPKRQDMPQRPAVKYGTRKSKAANKDPNPFMEEV